MAVGLLLSQYTETVDWLVTVHSNESRQVVASRQFDSKQRAERARTNLVAAAQEQEDLTGFDWELALART